MWVWVLEVWSACASLVYRPHSSNSHIWIGPSEAVDGGFVEGVGCLGGWRHLEALGEVSDDAHRCDVQPGLS